MKRGRLAVIIAILLFLTISILSIRMLLGKTVFQLRSVEIARDFPVDREKLISFLEIYPARPLWSYNLRKMKKQMSSQLFLFNYEITRRYPDTLVIQLTVRKAIARTIGADGEILLIDREGIIFKKARHQGKDLPLITFDKQSKIKRGIRISGKSFNIVDILADCADNYPNVYRGISQVSSRQTPEGVFWYEVEYRTHPQKVVIQNTINVETVVKGLVGTLYMDRQASGSDILVVTENGFAYSGE
jgi:hypothetical protein